MTYGPRSASRSEERVVEERLPVCEPSRIPAPTEQPVRGGDDRSTFVKYLGRSETHSLVVDLYEATIPSKVTTVHQTVAMDAPVVLMNSSSSDKPEVRPGDEVTMLVIDLLLWLNIDLSR